MLAKTFSRSLMLAVSLLSLTAGAADLKADAKSTIKTKPSKPLSEQIYFDFASVFHGPTVDRFGPISVNSRGNRDPKALFGFDNEANIAYLYDREREEGIGLDIQFSDDTEKPNKAFDMGDVGLKWFRHNTIDNGDLIVSTDAYLQAPTSVDSREDHMQWAFDTTPYVIYNVPGTRWRLGAWTEFRYRSGVDAGYVSRFYGAPYVVYKMNDKIWLQLLAESRTDHEVGKDWYVFRNTRTDIQPGVIWRVTPNVKIMPHLVYFPDNPKALEQMSVAVTVYARVL